MKIFKKMEFASFVAPVPATDDSTDVYPLEEEESLENLCDPACYTHTSCENCTSTGCMWCSNEQRCVESNSYVASFPYGQCMEWTTQKAKCPGNGILHNIHVFNCTRKPSSRRGSNNAPRSLFLLLLAARGGAGNG